MRSRVRSITTGSNGFLAEAAAHPLDASANAHTKAAAEGSFFSRLLDHILMLFHKLIG